jgi:hypothetical protein
MSLCSNLVCFGHLTRRANQGHIGNIADVEPAPETAAGFSFHKIIGHGGFNLSKPFHRIFCNLLRTGHRSESRFKSAKPVACSAGLYCDGQSGGSLPGNRGSSSY